MEEALAFAFVWGKFFMKFLLRIAILLICIAPALFMVRIGLAMDWLLTWDWNLPKTITLALAVAGVWFAEKIGDWLDL